MNVIEIPVSSLCEASWNPNQMDEKMTARLRESLSRYGLVEPLVVRPIDSSSYEVLSGNQRLKVIKSMSFEAVPCVIVDLNDSEAMLLAQALNGVRGEDDPGLRGELLRNILSSIPENEVLSILPETTESLKSLAAINATDLAEQLKSWEQARSARLNHMQLQLTGQQLETIEKAMSRILPEVKDSSFDNPNDRSNAIYLLCKYYLERS